MGTYIDYVDDVRDRLCQIVCYDKNGRQFQTNSKEKKDYIPITNN